MFTRKWAMRHLKSSLRPGAWWYLPWARQISITAPRLVVHRVLTLLKLLIMENYIPLFCACFVGVFIVLLIYGLAGRPSEGKPGIWPLINVWTTAFFIFR